MKQTNNAIKFLLAQYRAIFKHAYLKGIVSAAVLTAGLATGAANAANDISGGADWENAKDGLVDTDETISDSGKFFNNLDITNNTLTVATGSKSNNSISVKGTLTVDASGSLALGSGSTAGNIYGWDAKTYGGTNPESTKITGDLVSYGNITLGAATAKGQIQMNNITLKSGSITTISGPDNTKWNSVSMLIGGFGENGKVTLESGSNVTLGDNSQLVASQGSQIDIDGNVALTATADKIAIIRGADSFNGTTADNPNGTYSDTSSSAVINIGKTAQINASGSGALGIYAEYININGNTDATDPTISITSGSKLELDGDMLEKGKDLASAGNGAANITMNSGVINVASGGTLVIGNGSFTDTVANKTHKTTFDINGGKLTGAGTIQVQGKLNLGESVFDGFVENGKFDLSGGAVNITPTDASKAIELSDYTFGKSGSIDVSVSGSNGAAGATLKATNLSISKELTVSGGMTQANNLGLSSNYLTLGNNTTDSTLAGLYGDVVKIATVYDKVTFLGKDTFTIDGGKDLQLNNSDAAVKNIEGVDLDFTNGRLIVLGNWQTDQDITFTGSDNPSRGNILVGNGTKKDSSLTLTGTITNDRNSNTWGAISVSETKTNESTGNPYNATLDITGATLKSTGKGGIVTLAAGQQEESSSTLGVGKVILTGDQLTDILDDNNADTNGFNISLTSGSTVEVVGDFAGNFDDFTLGDSTKASNTSGSVLANNITINGVAKGGTIKADSATLTATDETNASTATSTSLDLQGATLDVKELTITNNTYTANTIAANVDVTGDFKVLNKLTSNNESLTLKTDSTLQLGDLSEDGLTALGGGSINTNLILDGATANVYSTWTGKNLDAKTGSTLNLYSLGSLTVNEFSAAAGTTTVNGTLVVNGIVDDATVSGSGLNLAAGSVTLNGNLTLGAGVAEDISFDADGNISGTAGITAKAIDLKGGTLTISFASGETLDSNELVSLKTHIFGTSAIDGTLNIGDANIGNLDLGEASGGRYDFDNVASVSDVTEGGVTNNQLTQNAFYTDDSSKIAGTVGGILLTKEQTANISKSSGFVNAEANGGYFVSTIDSSTGKEVAADINFTGTNLKFENGGTAGNVTATSTSGTVTVRSDAAETVIGNVKVAGTFDVQGPTTAKKVDVNTLEIADGKSLAADSLKVADNADLDGSLAVSGSAEFAQDVDFNASTTVGKDLTVKGDLGVFGDTNVSGTAKVSGDAVVGDNATFVANVVEGTATSVIAVGEDKSLNPDGTVNENGTTGVFQTNRLDLNGGILIADPNYGAEASLAIVDKLGKNQTYTTLGGVLNGAAVAAQNSIVALGVSDATAAATEAEVRELFSSLTDANGSLDQDNIGSILYIGKDIELINGSKLISNAYTNKTDALDALQNSTAYKYDGYIGKNSAIAIDAKALDGSTGVAVHFDKDSAVIETAEGAKVLLVGDGFNTRDEITLFTDNGKAGETTGVMISGSALTVETINGLFSFTYDANQETTGKYLTLNTDRIAYVFNDASAPVKHSLIAYASGDNNWNSTEAGTEDMLHGAVAEGLKYDATKGVVDKNGNAVENQKSYIVLDDGAGNQVVYHVSYNYFLDEVTTHEMSGRAAEQAARLGAYGGAAQAALSAGATTYDAISGRLGVGAQYGSITFADNGQGAGLWVTPIYKNHDSDGFGAQGTSYGVDMDMYGVALGGDFTLANGLRVGAAFNVGSGDADGQGMGNGVTNDFDYYGFAVYGGFTYDKFSIVGDISYTVVDNDVEANTAVEKISASMDSTNLSVGVTGQYELNYGGMSIVPHAGLRYTNVDMDDYNVKGSGDIAHFAADSFNVFSIPVGVTFSKDIVAGDWTIKPAFDLTLTANMGDDSVEGTVNWAGIDNLQTRVESEVIDSFTYGATLGVSAKTGNLSLGFGVNYTGASSADEYGVGANARFVF